MKRGGGREGGFLTLDDGCCEAPDKFIRFRATGVYLSRAFAVAVSSTLRQTLKNRHYVFASPGDKA